MYCRYVVTAYKNCVKCRMEPVAEVLLALAVIALTGCLSFAIILLVYRMCCRRRGNPTSVTRDDADRMLLGSSTPRADVKQLKRSAVRNDSRVAGLYAGVKSLRYVGVIDKKGCFLFLCIIHIETLL